MHTRRMCLLAKKEYVQTKVQFMQLNREFRVLPQPSTEIETIIQNYLKAEIRAVGLRMYQMRRRLREIEYEFAM